MKNVVFYGIEGLSKPNFIMIFIMYYDEFYFNPYENKGLKTNG